MMKFNTVSHRKIYLTLLILFLITFVVEAQEFATVSGKITDKTTGDPLIGANVFLKGTNKGTATGLDGSFKISDVRPGIYDVEFTYIGYKKMVLTAVRIEKNENKVLNIKLEPTSLTIDQEVVIVGDKPLIDQDQSKTENRISSDKIEASPVRQLAQLLNSQAGVINSPFGINIRGGRTYETGFYIDGVSAKDPLAGTGFGLDIGTNSIQEMEISTGSVDVEYGNSTAGTVNTKTRTGGNKHEVTLNYKRDNLGFNKEYSSCFNQQLFEMNAGGPLTFLEKKLPGKETRIRYYLSMRSSLSDEYIKNPAKQLNSSLFSTNFWSPYQDNRWSAFAKLNYDFDPTMRLTISYLKSININQDVNMLRVTGNDISFSPGYQYVFHLQPDNAATFTHESNLQTIRWNHTPVNRFSYQLTLSRLFVHLRADANGRPWRPENVDTEFDPYSIREFPVSYFNPDDDVVFAIQGPGLYNNNGITPLWHDHLVEEYTAKISGNLYSKNSRNTVTAGMEYKSQYLRWIDIRRPWVGAPMQLPDGSFSQSFRLGEQSDIWEVNPEQIAAYVSDKYKFLGLVANIGGRLELWAPGKFVDEAIQNPDAPIRDEIRDAYLNKSFKIIGKRYKIRFLPKISASFPVHENQVLYFNYGHSTVLPHPSYLYTGLDPKYSDRSTLSFVGNPDLDPEVDISYELGLRSQISSNDALNISAFWKDKYDFITSASMMIKDVTGKEVSRTIRINSDYARIRGFELTYLKRIKKWFQGEISLSYMTATGQSASASETIKEIINSGIREDTREYPLPWDRPLDIKFNMLFVKNTQTGFFNLPLLNKFKFYLEGNYRSGIRYTPYVLTGYEAYSGRPIYVMNTSSSARYSELGKYWLWFDANLIRWWSLKHLEIAASFEVTNIFNNKNAAIINPVTGKAYEYGDPVPSEWRDPMYNDPRDPRSSNLPPENPARYLPQRHMLIGVFLKFN
ncbi:MAG TPA: TonB-dependent receptor [Bacteroidia bacterium]|nr:TonB-dependent receptor [Bacteroidia bacterium]HRS58928.1 TonB-dependent receptor [Bacteroidia bacterium]